MAETNLAKEFTNLFVNHAEPHHYAKMHRLIDTGVALTDCIDQARQLACALRDAKKDATTFDFEKFKEKAEWLEEWLAQARINYPGYFDSIESPFGKDLKVVDAHQFLSNVESMIEKTQELITNRQSMIPLVNLDMEVAQKMYMLISEIMIEGLKQISRSTSSIVHKTGR